MMSGELFFDLYNNAAAEELELDKTQVLIEQLHEAHPELNALKQGFRFDQIPDFFQAPSPPLKGTP